MRRRFPIIVSAIVGVGLLAALFLSSNMAGRNIQRIGRNNTTPQGRNIIGENMKGANPYTGLNGGNMPIVGTATPATPRIVTPGPGTNMGINRIGQQIQDQVAFNRQKADNISKQLGNIDGIGQINTIVKGNTALVGYRPSNTVKDASSIKKAITDRVKQADNTITSVVLSDSADITSRIAQLSNSIKNNNPAAELSNEFDKLIRSIQLAA